MKRGQPSFHLVGAGRGGTSLLAGLLDANPQIEMGFERFAPVLCHGIQGDALTGRWAERLHLTDFLHRVGTVRSAETRMRTYLASCRREAERHPACYWANKITTEQLRWLDVREPAPEQTNAMLRMFFIEKLSGTPVIFILRDGRSCVWSKVRRTGMDWLEASRRWIYSVTCYRFFAEMHPRALCVRFEDLLRDPEKELDQVCCFLGMDYDHAMLQGTQCKKMRPEYRRKEVDPSKAEIADLPKAVEAMLTPYLLELNYV